VADEGRALRRENDGNHIEPQRAIREVIFSQKALCGPNQFSLFGSVYRRHSRSIVFIASGFDFNEGHCTISVGGNQVDFSAAEGEIPSEGSPAAAPQESFGLLLPPASQFLGVCQETGTAAEQQHGNVLVQSGGGCVLAVPLSQPYALSAALPQVIQFGPADFAAADRLDIHDIGRMKGKRSFDAFIVDNTADGEHFVHAAPLAGDDHTAEDLNAGFAAFFDAAVYIHGVPDFKVGNLFLSAFVFCQFYQIFLHGIFSCFFL
jgi:hypothetical protein